MKTIEQIKECKRLLIGQISNDGLCGELHLFKWVGSVIVSWGGGWEHVSVSPYKKNIIPSWEDMCQIKDIFFSDDEWVVQFHPAKSEYVSNKNNCLHLWRPINEIMPTPPSVMVGIRKGQSLESLKKEIDEICTK